MHAGGELKGDDNALADRAFVISLKRKKIRGVAVELNLARLVGR
jgi:hypothetical protein